MELPYGETDVFTFKKKLAIITYECSSLHVAVLVFSPLCIFYCFGVKSSHGITLCIRAI